MNNKEITKYWNEFLSNTNRSSIEYIDSYYFGRTEEIANSLADLVLKGIKKATTSCFSSYKINNDRLPEVGDLSIVTDWNEIPKCIIQTTCVTIVPFKDVTFDICKREGEDDNLKSWQDAHYAIYKAEGEKEGYEFDWDTLVVFEDFEMIYPKVKL